MSFIGRDGLLRKVAGLQALVRNDGGHQDLAQRAPVHAYLPPDRLRVLTGARGVVPAPADEPLVASYSVGLKQGRIAPGDASCPVGWHDQQRIPPQSPHVKEFSCPKRCLTSSPG